MKTIYIAHAGGGYNGFAYTNAKEAFIHSDTQGFVYAEIDFCRTADGDYAAIHDWHTTYRTKFKNRPKKNIPTSKEFLSSLPEHKGTSITLSNGFEEVVRKTNLRFLIDAKHDLLKVSGLIAKKFPKLTERFIPQAFTFHEYKYLSKLFPHVILILYRSRRTDASILSFCKKHHPFAVAISSKKSSRFYLSHQLQTLKVRVFCHTINDGKTAKNFEKKGFCGFYTDFLGPNGKKSAKSKNSA